MVNSPHLLQKSSIDPNCLTDPAMAAANRVYTVIKREMQLADNEANPGTSQDTEFSTYLCLATSRYCTERKQLEHRKLILDGLKWRFQMQERFLLAWQEMVKHGLLSMECVMRRISLDAMDSGIVFSIASEIERFDSFEDPTYWLATLIARCGTNNIAKVVRCLETWVYIGPMSEEDPLGHVKDVDYADGIANLFGSLDTSQYYGPMSQDDALDNFDNIEDVDGVDKVVGIELKGPGESKYINYPEGEFSTLTNHQVGLILPHGQFIRAWAMLRAKRYKDVLNASVDMCGTDSWDMDPHFAAMLQALFSQYLVSMRLSWRSAEKHVKILAARGTLIRSVIE
ncbi:hypothetical protein BM1_02032 [Bipolaris maydis]|nr:hypothetical protein BM1_02032 [Bipolaris maydis]